MTDTMEQTSSLYLTEACWPVFEFVTHFVRQVKYGSVPSAEQVRYEALTALRDAEDLARNDPVAERAWHDRIKSIMVYLIDYKMINTEWEGRLYWLDNPFETDPTILDHPQALGGEEFFTTCDDLQREYELADRRDRRDKDELAEQLSIYFICLGLGFKGQFHDRPQELADYTRRLFTRLPAYAGTRAKMMFQDAYQQNQELKVNYNLGMNLTIVLVTLAIVVAGWLLASRFAWSSAISEIGEAADRVDQRGALVDEVDGT
jgi:type IV/VI secretion system ImpK/VasF family protein